MVKANAVQLVNILATTTDEILAALGDAPVYLHLDPDVLDPSVNPVPYARPSGLSARGLRSPLAAVAARHAWSAGKSPLSGSSRLTFSPRRIASNMAALLSYRRTIQGCPRIVERAPRRHTTRGHLLHGRPGRPVIGGRDVPPAEVCRRYIRKDPALEAIVREPPFQDDLASHRTRDERLDDTPGRPDPCGAPCVQARIEDTHAHPV